jgi:esterase/lipase
MQIKVQGLNVNYIQYGKGKDILLLHGWGQNIQMMEPLGNNLNDFHITILDLPGFGESNEPTKPLTVHEYKDILNNIKKIIKDYKNILQLHGFYVDDEKKIISFDIIFSFDELKPEIAVQEIKSKLKELYPKYDFNIIIDSDFSD